MRWLRDFGLIVAVILGLAGGSQIPSFIDAYAQRLGGAVDELARQVAGHRAEAAAQGLTLNAYLERHRSNEDPAIQGSGRRLTAMVVRLTSLQAARDALAEAGPWSRPAVALATADGEIMANAYGAWQPGLTVDPRWGGLGAALGWLFHLAISTLLAKGLSLPRPRTRQTKT